MIQYNSLRKKGFNFRIDKKLMKKKILLKLKQCILSLRKAYNNQKELIIDLLNIYKCYFTDEEHQKWYDYVIKMAKNSTKRKLVQ